MKIRKIPPPDFLCGYSDFRKKLMLTWIRWLTWDDFLWRSIYGVHARRR